MWISIPISAWLFQFGLAQDHFEYDDYEVAPHGATEHSSIDCLTKCDNKYGECDACKENGIGPSAWCCNILNSDCPTKAVNALRQHISQNADHRDDHLPVMTTMNMCVQAHHFSIMVDSEEFLIPWHEPDVDNDEHDCFSDCNSQVGSCNSCDLDSQQGYCCPHSYIETADFCSSGGMNSKLFSAVSQHYNNPDHFNHHLLPESTGSGKLAYTCVVAPASLCYPNPCLNSGECAISGSNPICTCKTGFSGDLCATTPCDADPCKNSGVCSVVVAGDGSSTYTCDCTTTGFIGSTCEDTSPCDSNPCQNGGTCTDDALNPLGFTCSCLSGFNGNQCENDPCTTNPCSNGGTCAVSKDNNGAGTAVCTCQGIFIGLTCDDKPCDSNPCKNSGTCTNVDGGTFTCTCANGYSGNTCTDSVCDADPCQNGGTCTVDGTTAPYYTCACKSGFSGSTCEKDPCSDGPCKNSGSCAVTVDQNDGSGLYVCTCNPLGNYIGPTCEDLPCELKPCKNGATCTDAAGGTFNCYCTDAYYGDTCTESVCDSDPCKYDGTCSVNEALAPFYTCSCKSGYSGPTCETTPCSADPCQNSGTCSLANNANGYTCSCPEGIFGDRCEINCNTVSIVTLDCQTDFVISLSVDLNCFGFYYPGSDVTDIKVTAAASNDVTDGNTCTSFGIGESGNNHIYSKVCGADATYDSTITILTYKAKVSTDIASSSFNRVVVKPVMKAVELTCKYQQTVDGLQNIFSIADFVDTIIPAETGSVGVEEVTAESFQLVDGSYQKITSDVTLGSQVKVKFSINSEDMPIYVNNCKAKTSATTDNPTDFFMVQNGCVKTSTDATSALAQIGTKRKTGSCDSGVCSVELEFEQFAFVGTATTDSVELFFNLECSIAFGNAPVSCNARAIRMSDNSVYGVSVSYDVHAENKNIEFINGIAVERTDTESESADETDSSSKNISISLILLLCYFLN